jgi:[FeFe] hydrogenase H-cluster maturation GTPase HydF
MNLERDHIGFFGKMNSGKSTLMNLLTQQETSIVDATPGTTADTKVALQEIHGLGPVKFFDTAGLDESSQLGEKKRQKVLNVLKECDLVLLVINPAAKGFDVEQLVLEQTRELDKQLLVVFNLFEADHTSKIDAIEQAIPLLKFYPKIELSAIDPHERTRLLDFVLANYRSKNQSVKLLPFVQPGGFYILNIPMDEETPDGRFLRPQAMAVEYITRNWAYPVAYRMDLKQARSSNPEAEFQRFRSFLEQFAEKPRAIITDSQAMDIMNQWVPNDIPLTTFSIMMIHSVSRGRLDAFFKGVEALNSLHEGDKVLIAEACNHSRIQEDIGTVQIPKILSARFQNVQVEHNFGREFQDNKQLSQYKLVIHCGGCMISNQKLEARLRDLQSVGVPITNYGIFLSWAQGGDALKRVLKPWKIE